MTEKKRLFAPLRSVWLAIAATCLLSMVGVIGLVADLAALDSWISTGGAPIVRVLAYFAILVAAGVIAAEKFQRNRRTFTSGAVVMLSIAAIVAAGLLWPGRSMQITAENFTPLTIAVDADDSRCVTHWMTTRTPEEVLSISASLQELNDWTDVPLIADGLPARVSTVFITVQGAGPTSVVLTGLQIKVVSRQPPLHATVLDPVCGGPLPYRAVDVDLDLEQPKVATRPLAGEQIAAAQEKGWRLDPIAFPYQVSTAESEVFMIEAKTVECYCEWIAEFSWASAGRTGTLIADNKGKPFRTSGDKNASAVCRLSLSDVTCN